MRTYAALKAFLAQLARTFRPEDINVLTVTAIVTAIGKLATGIIPIIALLVVLYQFRIQKLRLRAQEIELKMKEAEKAEREKDGSQEA